MEPVTLSWALKAAWFFFGAASGVFGVALLMDIAARRSRLTVEVYEFGPQGVRKASTRTYSMPDGSKITTSPVNRLRERGCL